MDKIRIGNAPCSWGVEFGDDERNPPWQKVLKECSNAGHKGIELGPIGFMPEDPAILGAALQECDLEMIGGMVMQPFHDEQKIESSMNAVRRTLVSLSAHGAKKFVIINAIAKERDITFARNASSPRLEKAARHFLIQTTKDIAKMAVEEYGMDACLHPHAGSYCEYEDEIDMMMQEVDESYLKLCYDTGHCKVAGLDPIAFYQTYRERVSYIHLKDVSDDILRAVHEEKLSGFLAACAHGLFSRLGDGIVDFIEVRQAIQKGGFTGWATIEQDCDPQGATSPAQDAKYNMDYLEKISFVYS